MIMAGPMGSLAECSGKGSWVLGCSVQGPMGFEHVEQVGCWVVEGADNVKVALSVAMGDKLYPAQIVD